MLIVSEVCIVVAPAFLAAAGELIPITRSRLLSKRPDYMLVGRMMSYAGSENSPIGHTLVTKVSSHSNYSNNCSYAKSKIFVVCDVLSILAQAGGASNLVSHLSFSGAEPLTRYSSERGSVSQRHQDRKIHFDRQSCLPNRLFHFLRGPHNYLPPQSPSQSWRETRSPPSPLFRLLCLSRLDYRSFALSYSR